MAAKANSSNSRVDERHEKWFSGTIEALAERITPEEFVLIDEYQINNIRYPQTLMHNPVPLDIIESKPDVVRDLTKNVIRAPKDQRDMIRDAVKQDAVIKSLKRAKEEGHNADMLLDAMGARRTIIMIGIARAALPEMVAEPTFDNPTAIVASRASVAQQ